VVVVLGGLEVVAVGRLVVESVGRVVDDESEPPFQHAVAAAVTAMQAAPTATHARRGLARDPWSEPRALSPRMAKP
jgi:hypothetical protein